MFDLVLYIWTYDISNGYTKTAVIDYATSVIWIKRFNSAGEFELYLSASPEIFNMFPAHEMLITRDDSDTAMIPEKIELTTDAENGDYLTISGRSAESLIGRRIIPHQTNFSGTVENCIRKYINENIISPSDHNRQISEISLGAVQGYTETIDKQVTGKNLLETISELCTTYDYGFELTFTGTGFVFDLYKGVDRSTDQFYNNCVIFSPDFENLGNTTYSRDMTNYANVVYAAGEGEGSNRRILPVRGTNSVKISRRELWLDARNTSSTTDDGEMSISDYNSVLTEQGRETLQENRIHQDFSGEILNSNGYVYGVDYNLGDTVSIINEYGIKGTAVVSEITEVEDETGYRLIPTFSEWSV